MAIKLLSKKLQKTLHIALFFIVASLGVTATAQTVLLPGDVVIVSANADTQSIDFIPLIDIEEGTSLYFSNGMWDNASQTLSGEELRIEFNQPIQAGTNIHINSINDERIAVSGDLDFTAGTHRLFAYQKDAGLHRFIFGLGWGKGNVWSSEEYPDQGSDIPESLLENDYTLLTLGEDSNHQYYIRNGASGTRKLLLKFVGNASHWRSNEMKSYPAFGTSFNLLNPPVIFFDQSISTAQESDSAATINVAIYEHDGSRLSVDVVFDSLRSITSSQDYEAYKTTTLNFTGLIGDGVYEVQVPINDDEDYEGRETGIFTLENLSKGNFGDFLTHSLIIQDNEKPEVLISEVLNAESADGAVQIKNMEGGVVSLSGWTLEAESASFTFSDDAVLYPFESIKFKDSSQKIEADSSQAIVYSDLKEPLLSKNGGILVLKNFEGEEIHNFQYPESKKSTRVSAKREEMLAASNNTDSSVQGERASQNVDTQITMLQSNSPGLKVITNAEGFIEVFSETELFTWKEEEQQFIKVEESSSISRDDEILFAYFEADQMDAFSTWKESVESTASKISNTLSFSISATDGNENEVLDGLEGLNMVYNNLGDPIFVSRFLELTALEFPDVSISPNIYRIQQNSMGEVNFVRLKKEEEIPPHIPFWISIQSIQEKTEINLDLDQLNQPSSEELEDGAEEENSGLIEVSLTNESYSEKLQLKFVEDGISQSVKDLNSYSELFLQTQDYLNFAINQGEEFYNELTLSSKIEQVLTLPVSFSTTMSGKLTLSVSGWENIPADWEIILEDQKAEKEYNLRREFSLTFDYVAPEANPPEDEQQEEAAFTDYTHEERFLMHIRPKGAEVEGNENSDTLPREVELHQNFPNPFNPATTISFYLPESEDVRLSVFNIVGQPVAVITEGTMSAGEHQFEWDATDRPSGMYIYQLEVGKNVMTRKMTLVK